MNFSKRLAQIRKDKGYSQQTLADAVGVHVNQIKRYEGGITQPTLDTLIALAKALCVTLDGLVFAEEEQGASANLRMQFKAIEGMDEHEKQLASEVLDSLILRHQARQWTKARSGPTPGGIPRTEYGAERPHQAVNRIKGFWQLKSLGLSQVANQKQYAQ